ncbi:amidohydrolase family protein [Herbidospora sp. NEAU-GS84]|uniref:Amidohydrolase family protein n=1 Tax=Herbidospora solisilvae TaxID=2696284 RepID=A0A7C9JB16_9ACTN|nr:amidohydrolase family protein [Herbidospora solisilvae]NAS25288.1 amidohydrolase family protein [Herbidospora solisilvae]
MRVDVHHHAIFPAYAEVLEGLGIGAQPGVGLPAWSAGASLAMMDDLGIDLAVLSAGSPGFFFDGDQALARELCERTNADLAATVAEHPGRFRAFVAVPLPSVGDALHMIERWAGHDAFAGVGLLTNYAGRYLGDPAFEPVLAELDRRGAVVHVHPQLPVHYPAAEIHLRPSLIEYVFDTTRAIVNLTLNGAHDRYPGITWIFSHCGGTAPYLAGRLAIAEPLPELEQVGEGGIYRALRRFHYDFALATTPYALGSALALAGPERLLIGSDFPFVDAKTVAACLHEAAELLGPDLTTVAETNPARLFPNLKG